MKIHVYGKNKPILRGFDKDGNYKELRTASYSGHRIAKSLIEAQKYIQDFLKRGWDVQIEVETQKANI